MYPRKTIRSLIFTVALSGACTNAAPQAAPEEMKVAVTEMGHAIVMYRGNQITSITVVAAESQINRLRGAVSTLTGEKLAPQKACSAVITFNEVGGYGELRDCKGEFVGYLNGDAARILKDQISSQPLSP